MKAEVHTITGNKHSFGPYVFHVHYIDADGKLIDISYHETEDAAYTKAREWAQAGRK